MVCYNLAFNNNNGNLAHPTSANLQVQGAYKNDIT